MVNEYTRYIRMNEKIHLEKKRRIISDKFPGAYTIDSTEVDIESVPKNAKIEEGYSRYMEDEK